MSCPATDILKLLGQATPLSNALRYPFSALQLVNLSLSGSLRHCWGSARKMNVVASVPDNWGSKRVSLEPGGLVASGGSAVKVSLAVL
jgi:hypothetical protein